MPTKIKLKPHLRTAELGNRYREARDPVERSHYQIVWLIAQGKSTAELENRYREGRDPGERGRYQTVCLIAQGKSPAGVREPTGYSGRWPKHLSRRYKKRAPAALGDKRRENPGGADRALLDEEQ